MKKEVADKTIAALRSGNFVQGSSKLKLFNAETGVWNYCCLGVMCEISGAHAEEYVNMYDETLVKFEGSLRTLSQRAMNLTGVQAPCGNFPVGLELLHEGEPYFSLAGANDAGVPFSVIADFIEKHWEIL